MFTYQVTKIKGFDGLPLKKKDGLSSRLLVSISTQGGI